MKNPVMGLKELMKYGILHTLGQSSGASEVLKPLGGLEPGA